MARDFNAASNLAVVFAAVVVAGTSIYNSYAKSSPMSGGLDPRTPPEYVENWEQLEKVGIRTGERSAPVQIVEFADLECPFCAKYEATLAALLARYPGKVSRVLVHFPLDMHAYSRRAARALECATRHTSVETALSRIYSQQLNFSANPWTKIAADIGVKDTAAFGRCVVDGEDPTRITAGERVAKQIALTGTPSVLVNGYLYVGAPPDSVLDGAVAAILSGNKVPNASSKRASRKVDLSFLN